MIETNTLIDLPTCRELVVVDRDGDVLKVNPFRDMLYMNVKSNGGVHSASVYLTKEDAYTLGKAFIKWSGQ